MKPPKLRKAPTCRNCEHSILLLSNFICSCKKYDENVLLDSVCDSHQFVIVVEDCKNAMEKSG